MIETCVMLFNQLTVPESRNSHSNRASSVPLLPRSMSHYSWDRSIIKQIKLSVFR